MLRILSTAPLLLLRNNNMRVQIAAGMLLAKLKLSDPPVLFGLGKSQLPYSVIRAKSLSQKRKANALLLTAAAAAVGTAAAVVLRLTRG
jgi:hypothetical protein